MNDVAVLARALARLGPGLTNGRLCNVIGPSVPPTLTANGIPDDRDAEDPAALRRSLAALTPGVGQVCDAAAIAPDCNAHFVPHAAATGDPARLHWSSALGQSCNLDCGTSLPSGPVTCTSAGAGADTLWEIEVHLTPSVPCPCPRPPRTHRPSARCTDAPFRRAGGRRAAGARVPSRRPSRSG